jgi:hypothetical protein
LVEAYMTPQSDHDTDLLIYADWLEDNHQESLANQVREDVSTSPVIPWQYEWRGVVGVGGGVGFGVGGVGVGVVGVVGFGVVGGVGAVGVGVGVGGDGGDVGGG